MLSQTFCSDFSRAHWLPRPSPKARLLSSVGQWQLLSLPAVETHPFHLGAVAVWQIHMNVSIARRAACTISTDASGLVSAMLSLTVPLNMDPEERCQSGDAGNKVDLSDVVAIDQDPASPGS